MFGLLNAETTSQYCYNADDRFRIDKIEVLQNNVDIDGMIRDLGRSRVSDEEGKIRKTKRILEKIQRLKSEGKYNSTTSFNNDIGTFQESLENWQSPLNEDDIIA